MTLELIKWSPALKQELIDICNDVDRTFLSNRLPYPYTEESADWWLGMVSGHDGKDGVCSVPFQLTVRSWGISLLSRKQMCIARMERSAISF